MSTPTLDTPTPGPSQSAPHAYAAGLADGRADAATTTPDITTVRADWIAELAAPDYAAGYRAGLTFDHDLETLRTA